MSLYGTELQFEDLKIIGTSLAGIRTSLLLPEIDVAFDVAQGLPFAVKAKHYFISHCHMDHAAGIPYLISLKALNKLAAPTFYVPESFADPIREIMQIWQKAEGHTYGFEIVPVTANSSFEIAKHLVVRSFPTVHRVPSFGYTIFQRHKKLKPEFAGLNRDELLKKKSSGIDLNEHWDEPFFTFTGDTQIEFLDAASWIKKSKYLVMECTYYDNRRTIEQARAWGHIHLDEVLPRLPELECEKIILIHRSSRYSFNEAQSLVRSRCSDPRVVLFPEGSRQSGL
jgi:ribonuclease Z